MQSSRSSRHWRGTIPRRRFGSTWPRPCSGSLSKDRWDILDGLLGHSEDVSDHNLPLMDWYAAEPLAAVDARRALRLAASSKINRLQEFMARRVGSLGTPESLAILVEELGRAPSSAHRETLLVGIEEGLRGRRQVAMPADRPKVFSSLLADKDARVRSRSVALALTFGDPKARTTLREVLADAKADLALRREALAALLKVKDTSLAGPPAHADLRPRARRSVLARALGIRRPVRRRRPDRRLRDPRATAASGCLEYDGRSQGVGSRPAGRGGGGQVAAR